MHHDVRGLAVTAASAEAVEQFDRAIASYLGYRLDTPQHVERALAADPAMPLAHAFRGYQAMLSYNRANLARAGEALAAARAAAPANPREALHLEALDAWQGGRLWEALCAWERILERHPTDVLALRLSHFTYFWLGEAGQMRASAERAARGWSDGLPGYPTVLSCLAFAREECGDYGPAEAAGREAVARDPTDLWGTHAVAHVLEMQGRHGEGIAWLDGLKHHWVGVAHIVHHLWWHRALYHFERGEFDQVLRLYDEEFRNLDSPLTKAMSDLYIDVQNAAAMLWRLEQAGVAVGERWVELADKAEARIGDTLSAFTQPHWMMALAATGRDAAADRLAAAVRAAAGGDDTLAPIHAAVTVPLVEAARAHRRGEWDRVVALLAPDGEVFRPVGGSHAQRDVFQQMLLDAMRKAGTRDLAAALLERERRARPVPLAARRGYAGAA